MTERVKVELKFRSGDRVVTCTAYEQVGAEDCYSMLMKAVMHRYITNEDVVPTIGRDVKDLMIKQSLVI